MLLELHSDLSVEDCHNILKDDLLYCLECSAKGHTESSEYIKKMVANRGEVHWNTFGFVYLFICWFVSSCS